MKITRIKTFPMTALNRRFFFVKVETDEGLYGMGEVGILSWSRAIEEAIHQLAGLIEGEDPFSTEALWQLMFRRSFVPAGPVVACALSAIDIALWDIKGKALGVPLYKLLGGPVRDKVVCYPHNAQSGDVEELVDSCRQTAADGWKFVRFGMPYGKEGVYEPVESVRECVKMVAAVRDALGDDVEICLDVHTRLSPSMAIRLARGLEPYELFFIEDPIRAENPASLRAVAQHISIPIATGETWNSKWAFRQVIEEELIQYARVDLCIAGGLTEALKITHWCETHYIDVAPHNPLGPVSSAASAHLCLASTNVGVLEMPIEPGTHLKDLFPVQIPWSVGYVLKPEGPGLGVEFDEEVAAEYSRDYEAGYNQPIWRREDGAFAQP